MKVKSIKYLGVEPVFNMEVENHHNFSVNGGFIVHNCDALRTFCSTRPAPSDPYVESRTDDFDDDDDDLENKSFNTFFA